MNEEKNTPALTSADKDGKEDAIRRLVLKDYQVSKDYVQRNYEKTWDDAWKCYNNIRTLRGYEGVSDDFVPETFTIVETMKANVFGGKPKFNYLPMREEQKQDTKVLNAMADNSWALSDMTQKMQNAGQDFFVLGNGIIGASWEGDRVDYFNIPLRDFFVDPTATHMNRPENPGYPKYAGYRYLTTVEELKNRKIVDPETGEMEQLYKNLDAIKANSTLDDNTDKQKKEMVIGSTLDEEDAKSRQVEVIVYYTRKKKILIANRDTIIYNGDNPYSRKARKKTISGISIDGVEREPKEVEIPAIKGFLPFAILRNYIDASLFYAKGDVENIISRQEALNDVSSQKHDMLTYALTPMWQIDPQFKNIADQIESVPGAVFPVPQGALNPIERQLVGADADIEMQRIQGEMRRATAADEAVQGVAQQKGRVTATEVQSQIAQGSQRFATKRNTIENEGLAQIGRITYKMFQIFLTQEMTVRVVGPDGVSWQDYDPDEYVDEYEPKIVLESTVQAQRQEEGQKYAVIHQLAQNSQFVDQRELMRLYFETMLDVSETTMKALLPPQLATPQPQGGIDPAMLQAMGGSGMGTQPNVQNPAGTPSGPMI